MNSRLSIKKEHISLSLVQLRYSNHKSKFSPGGTVNLTPACICLHHTMTVVAATLFFESIFVRATTALWGLLLGDKIYVLPLGGSRD